MTKKFTAVIALVAAVFMLAPAAQAQFSFGPRIGVAVNKLRFDSDMLHSDNRAGFTAGVEAQFMIPGLGLGLDASLMYVRRSADFMSEYNKDLPETDDPAYHLQGGLRVSRDYIDIPIYVKWRIGLPVIGKIVSPYLVTGPDFAFLTSRRAITEAWRNKTVDVAWNVGAGLQLFTKLQLTATYGFGITDATKRDAPLNDGKYIDGKNRYWTITAAWLF